MKRGQAWLWASALSRDYRRSGGRLRLVRIPEFDGVTQALAREGMPVIVCWSTGSDYPSSTARAPTVREDARLISRYPISRNEAYPVVMTFTDTVTTLRRNAAPVSGAVERERFRSTGGKLPSDREREIIEARRARKRAA